MCARVKLKIIVRGLDSLGDNPALTAVKSTKFALPIIQQLKNFETIFTEIRRIYFETRIHRKWLHYLTMYISIGLESISRLHQQSFAFYYSFVLVLNAFNSFAPASSSSRINLRNNRYEVLSDRF